MNRFVFPHLIKFPFSHSLSARMTAPQSIRAIFGTSDTRNAVHGSGNPFHFTQSKDSQETAQREIKFFFPSYPLKE